MRVMTSIHSCLSNRTPCLFQALYGWGWGNRSVTLSSLSYTRYSDPCFRFFEPQSFWDNVLYANYGLYFVSLLSILHEIKPNNTKKWIAKASSYCLFTVVLFGEHTYLVNILLEHLFEFLPNIQTFFTSSHVTNVCSLQCILLHVNVCGIRPNWLLLCTWLLVVTNFKYNKFICVHLVLPALDCTVSGILSLHNNSNTSNPHTGVAKVSILRQLDINSSRGFIVDYIGQSEVW